MPPLRIVTVTLILLATAFTAAANDITIGSTPISLTAPSGHCELNDTQESDANLLKPFQSMPTDNRLLAAYADCLQLNNVQSGKALRLDDFAMYFTPHSALNTKFPPDAIKQVCARMREKGEQTLANLMRDKVSRIEEAVKGLKINETRFLGVLAEEPTTCYTATLQKFAFEGGQKTQFNLSAAMVVTAKFIHYHTFTPYRDDNTVTEMLAKHKTNVAAFLAANKVR